MTGEEDIRGKVTRDESTPTVPRPGDYYSKARETEDGDSEALGELVLVLYLSGDSIRYVSLNASWSSTVAEFLASYDYDPEGADKREEEIRAVRRELREMLRRGQELRDEANAVPQLGFTGGAQAALPAGPADEAVGTPEVEADLSEEGLVPPGALATRREQMVIGVERTKLRVAETRNSIQLFLSGVAAKKARLEILLKEQEALFAALSGLSGLVKRLNRIIFVLNVYLGHNEEIIQIAEGTPAPADTKISVRQLVLFADEECAISAEEGGIDWESLDEFDRWVTNPVNLQQVLPEPKGILALKPRRKDKDYGDDSIVSGMMNARNKKTYFLIRNGENIFRIASEVEVGDYLFAPAGEFERLFTELEIGAGIRIPLRPGSRDFAEAMQKADEKARMYGMVALLIQGLIDRTDIFRPFLFDDINILDVARHEQHIAYIRDGERALLTGRPKFGKWLGELRRQVDVGQRIVGIFNMYGWGLERGRDDRCYRLTPPNAPFPRNNALHTVERRDASGYYILYERSDRQWEKYDDPVPNKPGWVYKRQREVGYKKRASCLIEPDDGFFIPFDLVTTEDVRFYLGNRTDRQAYTQLFPLLKMVLRLKEEERREEEPFRKLLVGQIMREHKATLEEAEAEIDGLVSWFKGKVRQYRSLRKDDSKALRMIVAEFGLKRKRASEREARRREEERIIEAIRAGQPEGASSEIIFIGHKSGDTYVALAAENEESIFVREQDWRWDSRAGKASLGEVRRWRTVDKRRERWAVLWSGERWERWAFDVNGRKYLTDPEREELIGRLWGLVRSKHQEWNTDDKARRVFVPIALAITPAHRLHAYYWDKKGVAPRTVKGAKGGEGIKEPNLSYLVLSWRRDRHGAVSFVTPTWSNEHDASYAEYSGGSKSLPEPGSRPWDFDSGRRKQAGEHGTYRVLWVDEGAVERFEADWRRVLQAKERDARLDAIALAACHEVDEAMLREIHRKLRERYDADHNPPELWKSYLSKLRIIEPHGKGFWQAAGRVVHDGRNIIGKTVREVVDMAAELGVEIEAEEAAILPYELVITAAESKAGGVEESDEDEEGDGGEEYVDDDDGGYDDED